MPSEIIFIRCLFITRALPILIHQVYDVHYGIPQAVSRVPNVCRGRNAWQMANKLAEDHGTRQT
jgi:hypothetical protein